MLTIVKPEETKNKFVCEYCHKEFSRETSIAAHMCETKRRYLSQHERGVQVGFQAFVRFYQIAAGSKRTKTFDDFVKSAYYRAFVKFGRYCVDIRAVNPQRFIEWLLKHNKKLDYWCSDQLYTEYLIDYLHTEAVDDALARAIEYSIDWGEQNSSQPHDYLRYGNHNSICYAITTGRISPWVIYNCESGRAFLGAINANQVAATWPYIDSDVWLSIFQQKPYDQTYAQDILKKAGW